MLTAVLCTLNATLISDRLAFACSPCPPRDIDRSNTRLQFTLLVHLTSTATPMRPTLLSSPHSQFNVSLDSGTPNQTMLHNTTRSRTSTAFPESILTLTHRIAAILARSVDRSSKGVCILQSVNSSYDRRGRDREGNTESNSHIGTVTDRSKEKKMR